MRCFLLATGILGAATLATDCRAQIFDNPFSPYFERSITITPNAGNAADTNAAIQRIDPWPPYAGYTRIPSRNQHPRAIHFGPIMLSSRGRNDPRLCTLKLRI